MGGSNAEDLRNRWAKFIFRYEEPKGSVKPRFLPLSFTAAAMVLDHNFDDSVALELNASFRCCEVYLGVDSVPLSNTHQTNCEYCPTNFPPFKSETAVKVNGATVLFLACIVLHNPRACSKLLGMHCTGSLILEDLQHLDLSRFTSVDQHHSYWLGHMMDSASYFKNTSTMRLLSRAMSQLIL